MSKANELVQTWREMGPVAWCESAYGWIGEDGQPVQLTPWQRAILQTWWENRETCSTLAISNVKKTGKTFLNAVLLCWRWLALQGVHFSCGNDLDQAAARSFSEISAMVKRHPFLAGVCKVYGKELTFEPTGSKLTALAADATGNAGANHLTASHTEAWGIIYEAGIRAFEELTPPPGRSHGFLALRICDSYAGYEGQSKTWHDIVDRGLKGEKISSEWPIYKAGGLILFHMEGEEARERCFRGTPQEAAAYYAEQQASLRPNGFTRMHGNQRTSSEAAFITPEAWEACYSPSVKPLQPQDGRRMVLGADASTTNDLTALVGSVFNFDIDRVEVVYTRVWRPVKVAGIRFGKPTIDLNKTIGAEVLRLHEAGQVAAVVADNYQLHSLILTWQQAGIKVIELAQNAGRVESDQALYTAILGKTIQHYGDPTLNEHIKNAVAIETPRGFRLAKEKTSLKIDAAVALSMSHWGAMDKSTTGEMTVVPDPFAYHGCDEQPIYAKAGRHWIACKPGTETHKPGITRENCRKNNGEWACAACVKELNDSGYYTQQEERDRSIDPMSEETARKLFYLQFSHHTPTPEEDQAEETRKNFWKTIENRSK